MRVKIQKPLLALILILFSCGEPKISRKEVSDQINGAGQDTVKKFRDVKQDDSYPVN